MKIKPEVFLIQKQKVDFKKILVTGNDETFINYTTQYLIDHYKMNGFFIEDSGDIRSGVLGNLFSEKKVLFFFKNPSSKNIDEYSNTNENILVSSNNAKSVKNLKLNLTKSKDSVVFDCYPLSRAGKELVVKGFVNVNKIKISSDVYWYIVENFENEYVFLINQLHSLLLFNKDIVYISDVEKIVFIENKIEINKIFFQILKNNKLLITFFNKNIFTNSDFYIFLNSIKLYLSIISSSKNQDEAVLKFPKYMFNEKDVFLKIYNYLNKTKIKKIYKNIFRAERLLRSNSSLFSVIGLRFLINTKKIIIS